MDISTIQMHLDNFVNTWKGWNSIVQGVESFNSFAEPFVNFHNLVASTFDTVQGTSSLLSSK